MAKPKSTHVLLKLALTALLVFTLSISALAATFPSNYISTSSSDLKSMKLCLVSNTNEVLNVYGSYPADGTNVTTWINTNDSTQRWYIYRGGDNITTVRPKGGTLYSLSKDSANNCVLRDLTTLSEFGTVQINGPYSNNTSPTTYAWSMKLLSTSHILSSSNTSVGNGYNVNWKTTQDNTNQIWHIDPA